MLRKAFVPSFSSTYAKTFLKSIEFSGFEEIFKLLWQKQIYNVNIMFEDKSSGRILVKTFMPFFNESCSNTKPVLINEFKDGKFSSEDFYPEKMKNLQKCDLKAAIVNSSYPFFIRNLNEVENKHVAVEVYMIEVMSKTLNFKLNYTFIGGSGYLYANGSSKGPFRAFMDGLADISFYNWMLTGNRVKFFDFTTTFIDSPVGFAVPPGRDFSAIEKLVYPFKLLCWIFILMVFILGIFVIFFIKKQSKTVQDFVFGKNVKNPYLNIPIGFVGGSQNILPKFNFARFLLMCFLLYSMVIQTIYQGSFYNLLKSNKRHEPAQTIDEMIERDYKFYALEITSELFQSSPAIKDRFDLSKIFSKTFNFFLV
jgi:uncharacterized protein with PQ loop repeat